MTGKIKFYPKVQDDECTFGSLKNTYKLLNRDFTNYTNCHICNHKFEDCETPEIVTVEGVGNRLICYNCAKVAYKPIKKRVDIYDE